LWSLEESVALLLGKSPGELNWKSVQPFVSTSEFAREYERLRGLALKAEAMNRGQRPVPPSTVMGWAAQSKIDVPAGLLASIEARQAKKLAIAASRHNQKPSAGVTRAVEVKPEEPPPSTQQTVDSPTRAGSPPVLTSVVVETPQQRRNRLSKRREQLKLQGVREIAKRLASEEGVSPKRVRTILKKPKPATQR
jgi:hypothetical protein